MKHKKLILLITLVLFLSPFADVSAEWTWQNPLPTGNNFNGVWGSSASDVFAVGGSGTILHYNGSSWSAMTSGTTQYLNGVWGSSGSDVFAVGGGYYMGGYSGTILHYNGSAWSAISSGTLQYLYGVWGSSGSDVFTVGYDNNNGNSIIFHYNGNDWSSMLRGCAKITWHFHELPFGLIV